MLLVVLLAADTGRRRALEIARPDDLVEGALVPDLYALLDLRVLDHEEPPALRVAPVGRAGAGLEDLLDQLVGHRVGLQSAHRAHRLHDLEQVRVAWHRAPSFLRSVRGGRIIPPSGCVARDGRKAPDRRNRDATWRPS